MLFDHVMSGKNTAATITTDCNQGFGFGFCEDEADLEDPIPMKQTP
jgi:hypothetical protein